MLYFDNNANVPMTNNILKQYNVGAKLGNISNDSKYAKQGMQYKKVLDDTLKFMYPGMQVIYTSGGSESNATVINMFKNSHIVCPMSEHWSIIKQLEGCDVSWVKPLPTGHVNYQELLGNANQKTKLIILQSVNSETGAIQDLQSLATDNKEKIHIHCDDVQGFKKRSDMRQFVYNCSKMKQPLTIALSFHKIGAPIGFGALLTNVPIIPLIGGKQNSGIRGGTYNIAAMIATLQAIQDYDYSKIIKLRKLFDDEIKKHFLVLSYSEIQSMTRGGAKISSDGYIVSFNCSGCLPHTIFIAIGHNDDIACNKLVKTYLDDQGIIIASGSACNTTDMENTGSMRSADIPDKYKNGFLRISISCYNTTDEIKKLVSALASLQY